MKFKFQKLREEEGKEQKELQHSAASDNHSWLRGDPDHVEEDKEVRGMEVRKNSREKDRRIGREKTRPSGPKSRAFN